MPPPFATESYPNPPGPRAPSSFASGGASNNGSLTFFTTAFPPFHIMSIIPKALAIVPPLEKRKVHHHGTKTGVWGGVRGSCQWGGMKMVCTRKVFKIFSTGRSMVWYVVKGFDKTFTPLTICTWSIVAIALQSRNATFFWTANLSSYTVTRGTNFQFFGLIGRHW